ncbi:MAG TPA: FkbM family methyltransferase [Pyrinomonadaceae bacterium]|nr:FkbM family methyltransferase [Pyrinomonadaceae bacterium]
MVKKLFRAIRSTQPFNYATTSVVKAVSALGGGAPDAVVRHLPRIGRVCTRLPNSRVLCMYSRGDDLVTNQIFWRGWGGYEPETAPVFFELAREARAVMDVGAHVGYFSLIAALANPEARVLAFEPLPKAAERFRLNVSLTGVRNVKLFECAVGDAKGAAPLFHLPDAAEGIPSSSGLSSGFYTHPFWVESGVVAGGDVSIVTLDEVAEAEKLDRVDLLKIDTESTEPGVLAGAERLLARDRPDIIVEVLPGQGTAPEISRLLKPLGYTFYLLRDSGPERRRDIEEDPAWPNYLARAEVRPK